MKNTALIKQLSNKFATEMEEEDDSVFNKPPISQPPLPTIPSEELNKLLDAALKGRKFYCSRYYFR